jgi:hypothetical protein
MKFDAQIRSMHLLGYEILLEFSSYTIFDWVDMRDHVWPVNVKHNVDVCLHKV